MIDTTARLLKAFDEPDPAKRYDVVWLAEVGADRHKVLHAAPLWVGGLLRERLFGPLHGGAHLGHAGPRRQLRRAGPAVGTSAPAEARTDDPVPDPEAPKWSGLDVGSPFAHAKSGILYVAKSLPPPGRDGLPPAYLDEIAGLVEAAGGRTLGLFSSMRAAKQATEALRDRLATPLLCQGDDATMLLVKRFAEDDETSLFGTLSLWQGVDVPGPSLSCVIIDRIPFPRPDDPLVSARQRAADSRGGNGFLQVSATHAALLLAQGAGRLLRGMDDRGVVAILDPRLATARYGGFLRGLPPAVLADGRPGEGPRGPAPPARRLTAGTCCRWVASPRGLRQLRLQRRGEAGAEADVAEQPRELRGPGSRAARASAPTSAVRCSAISPPARWCQPPTMRPSTHAVGPPLPLRSNSSATSAGSRWKARCFQPIVDGSRPGSSTADGGAGGAGLHVVGQHVAGPLVQRHLDRADVGQRALGVAAVQPAHQARSTRVPGPNAASHRRASPAAAARGTRGRRTRRATTSTWRPTGTAR